VLTEDGLEARAVGVVRADRLAETRRAFDHVASTYDRANQRNPILRAMRSRARRALERSVLPGARLLDLGSGPGTDLVPLARAGYDVTGIDWSPAMVDEARRRIDDAGVGARARVENLGIHQLSALAPVLFDAAYSNFGALNCVADLDLAAADVSARIRSRGVLVATVIGRVCPWEIGLYLSRGSWSRATIRFSRDAVAVPLEGRTVWTRYYSPSEFMQVFSKAGFTTIHVKALGCAAPPPYLEAFAERRPRLVASLHGIDDLIGSWPCIRACGDHFLIVMRRA
jgi:ubiquinone/menaquinone biosynthesis C-methylase UbiE